MTSSSSSPVQPAGESRGTPVTKATTPSPSVRIAHGSRASCCPRWPAGGKGQADPEPSACAVQRPHQRIFPGANAIRDITLSLSSRSRQLCEAMGEPGAAFPSAALQSEPVADPLCGQGQVWRGSAGPVPGAGRAQTTLDTPRPAPDRDGWNRGRRDVPRSRDGGMGSDQRSARRGARYRQGRSQRPTADRADASQLPGQGVSGSRSLPDQPARRLGCCLGLHLPGGPARDLCPHGR